MREPSFYSHAAARFTVMCGLLLVAVGAIAQGGDVATNLTQSEAGDWNPVWSPSAAGWRSSPTPAALPVSTSSAPTVAIVESLS
jgi:hypothetical protein